MQNGAKMIENGSLNPRALLRTLVDKNENHIMSYHIISGVTRVSAPAGLMCLTLISLHLSEPKRAKKG